MCVLHVLQRFYGIDLLARMQWHTSPSKVPRASRYVPKVTIPGKFHYHIPLGPVCKLINDGAMTVRSNLKTACKRGMVRLPQVLPRLFLVS